MGIKLYAYGAAALALVAFGAWVYGLTVRVKNLKAELKATQVLMFQYQTGISERDSVISTLRGMVDSLNTTVAQLGQDKEALEQQLGKARGTIAQLQAQHDADEQAHQQPLPGDCEAAVREFAKRGGAKP